MTETPELSIYEKAFAKSDKTDAILVVDGKKLHVNKALLSYHSDYFKTLFNSEFKEKSMEEIPIEDVKFEDFATLLSLVHDKMLEINSKKICKIPEKNAENLLKLADRFLLSTPKNIVINVIKISTEFSRHEKLMLADKYKLDDLLEYVISLYNSKQTFQDFFYTSQRKLSESHKAGKMTETPELTIYEKAFAKSDKTDAILLVDGKKLHVNKALLSYHSDYFNTLFNSEFKEKSMEEIEIKDVKFEDFAILLSLVHEKPLKFTKQNVENLLDLADRFLMQNPKYIIESIVKISTEFNQMEKLMLADKYGLDDLLEFALKMYNSKESFRDFYFGWNRTFSDSSKARLFDYFFKNYGNCC